ncbi:MAG TPA: VCBS repeat-containing protein, partial [Geobacteraceae bacterium]|nr:VCBS repeat-containing protein [Geobacteraceae bacterium]
LEVEKNFASSDKIISIDCADLDGDKIPELYVTMLNGENLASRVYLVENGKFKQIASNLSYYFRGFSPKGAGQKIYVQTMGINDDFYGDMYELVKKGSSFETINPMKLPRFGNLYNVNLLSDKDGNTLFVLLHPDGFLTVSDDKGENVWRSSDKYGGTEMYFTRDDMQNIRVTGSQFRKRFIEQRITVTRSGEVIVPKNEGNFVIGNSRSFSKSSIYAFTWNGAALDELWHTKLDQNYLSDYYYDSEHKELVMLEVVKKAGITEKGASAIFIKRVE